MAQYGFYVDTDKCSGCKTCQVACKETYGLSANNLFRRVYNYQGGAWELNDAGSYVAKDPFTYFVSVACNHCEVPACLGNCPVGAISKDDDTGIVTIDRETCIGCKTCIAACPYNAPTYVEEEGTTAKCDMCAAEVAQGKKPVCVAGCPMRALDFGDMEDLKAKYGEGTVEIEPLPENTTKPSLIVNPHRNAQKTGEGTGAEVSFDEELNL